MYTWPGLLSGPVTVTMDGRQHHPGNGGPAGLNILIEEPRWFGYARRKWGQLGQSVAELPLGPFKPAYPGGRLPGPYWGRPGGHGPPTAWHGSQIPGAHASTMALSAHGQEQMPNPWPYHGPTAPVNSAPHSNVPPAVTISPSDPSYPFSNASSPGQLHPPTPFYHARRHSDEFTFPRSDQPAADQRDLLSPSADHVGRTREHRSASTSASSRDYFPLPPPPTPQHQNRWSSAASTSTAYSEPPPQNPPRSCGNASSH